MLLADNSGRYQTLGGFGRYRIHWRQNQPRHMFKMSKLTQQLFIDMYVKVESYNMNFIRFHQETFRVMDYQGLHNYVNTKAHHLKRPLGQFFILPSSFQVIISLIFYFIITFKPQNLTDICGKIIKMPWQ